MAASQDWITKDFYAALGVDKDASQADIKKAYNSYARKYHPDRNPGNKEAEEKFKAASEAYQVLSDPEDRKQYDAIRSMAGGGARFSSGGGGFEDIFTAFGGGNGGTFRYTTGGADAPGFEDILSQMFGGGGQQQSAGGFGGFGGFGSRRRPERGADLTASISIPLRQAVDGTTVTVQTGGQNVTAKVPAGITDGQKIRIRGKGRPGVHGGEPGDVLVTVNVEPHPVYEVKGKDVYVNVPVSFDEATLGATIEVPTIYGKKVKVKVPAGSSSDKLMRVRRKGIDNGRGDAGDMYVRLKVVVPKKLSDHAREIVEQFRDATTEADPRREFHDMAKL
ncbi:DnaJ C-terminal domain-containing protein [Trueperella bialowiezensis]|uniref:Curved DNA-binding protein n=1 Tax=Trueperella bialowiezensis TaxID=312285 RepID=A0A448PF39_9ACTO|nr:J domain-containing protein [Trueperella bialowiezensis]VEI13553.1 Curved DNA-binding protein [Trueperella bialowiezensis]